MQEGGPRPYDPKRQVMPCGVRIMIDQWPDSAPARVFRKGTYMSVDMGCDTCPAVRMNKIVHADSGSHESKDKKRAQLKGEAGILYLRGCRQLSELERKDPSNLPPELR
ncbi:MAG: hypothetical protein ABSD69_01460 [Candidatus Levyibacteriota bacterium]